MKRYQLLAIFCSLLLSVSAFAQNTTVKGKVTDAAGTPIIGAGVIAANGTGTTTDMDGDYSISVAPNSTLTFSSLGYKNTTVSVANRAIINVTLEDDTKFLDEVVVMGYTSQKKNEISSSVVSLRGDELVDAATPDLGTMLQGKAAGVLVMNSSGQPGSSADIRIRGTGSISASASPLYVVDGVAGGQFSPNDIETVTILKDASATALYGASAAGGVIVITTKSAKNRDRVDINFKANVGIKKALTGRFRPMNSEELYYTQKEIYSKTLFKSLRPESILDQDFDWMHAFLSTGVVQDYYASVSGISGRTNYFVSIDHYDETGALMNTNYLRNSARVNLSTALSDKLNLNIRLSYNRSNSREESSYVTLEAAYRALPWDIPYDENTGERIYIDSAKRSDNAKPWYSHDKYNVLHNELYNYAGGSGEEAVADVQLVYNILPWLTFTTTNRFDSYNSSWKSYIDPRTVNPSYAKNGRLHESFSNGWGIGVTDVLKAHTKFANSELSGIVGFEYGRGFSQSMSAEGDKMPNGQDALSNCVMQEITGYDYDSASWAALAQAQYSYKEKYIATASIRYDKTYKFAPATRGGFFPGVSAAWLIDKEPFMDNATMFDMLKVRVGYGKTGNDSITPFLYQDAYTLSAKYNSIVAAVADRQSNPNLGWEEAYMTSFGIESRLFDRVNIAIDLYNTDNRNILLAVPQAPSTGFNEFTANVGSINNKGIEFAADADILKIGDFKWNFGLNVGYNKNTVVYLPNGELTQAVSGVYQVVREGEDIYSWYMPKWLGVNPDNGDPMWEVINEDGTTSTTNDYNVAGAATNYQICGTASPKLQGGFTTTLRWKNFTLNANASFVYGNKVYNYTRTTMDSDGAYQDYNMLSIDNGLGWSRWEQPGDVATHPKLILNGNHDAHKYSSRYLEDGSFLRLKNVVLSYNLTKPIFNGFIQGGRVFVSADNILTLSRFSGMDPEMRLDRTEWSLAGYYSHNYPVPMAITFGLEVKF